MIYGGYRLRYNGCEVIAAYNVLKYLGKFKPIYSVIRHAELNDWYLFPVAPTGVLGSTPRKMKSIFNENNLKYSTYANTASKKFEAAVKDGKICIGCYSNRAETWYYNFSIHTFAFYYNKRTKKYVVFNGYGSKEYNSYSDLRYGGRYFLYGYIFK